MKNIMKKFMGVILSLTLALTVIPAAAAEAAPSVPASQTVYKTSATQSSTYGYIYIQNLSKSSKITKSSVKSSNTKVLKPSMLTHSNYGNSSTHAYFNGQKDSKYSYNNYSAEIGLQLLKKGTSTVSFKIGSKTYKTKVTVQNYTNPIKSITITGIKSGSSTNLVNLTKKSSNASLKLTKTNKNVQLKVAAKSGWKINNIYFYDNTNMSSYYFNSYSKPVSSATLRVGTMTAKKPYRINITFVNTKNAGTITVSYDINY